MKKSEMIECLGYLSAAVGKPVPSEKTIDVYFDLLGEVPLEVLRDAVKVVSLNHKWATFPTAAELWAAAQDIQKPQIASGEAWGLAWEAVKRIDLEINGSLDRACEHLPPLVVDAMRAYGLASLCYGTEPLTVVRSQFTKIYDQLAARQKQQDLLPNAGRSKLPGATTKFISAFGSMPEGVDAHAQD